VVVVVLVEAALAAVEVLEVACQAVAALQADGSFKNENEECKNEGDWGLGIGDWGLGIGDWGLVIGDW